MIASILAVCLAQPASWGFDAATGSLVWAGERYQPVGLRIPASVSAIDTALASGVQDLLLEVPPQGWIDAIKHAEAKGARYVLALNHAAPMAQGYLVEPEAYRFGPFSAETVLRATIPGCEEALVFLVNSRDGTPVTAENPVRRVRLENGAFQFTAPAIGGNEQVALVVPLVRTLRMPDLGAGLDAHRDILLANLRKTGTLAGLRGVIDPMGTLATFPAADLRFVPTDDRFRRELEVFLREKYGSVQRALQGWEITAGDQSELGEIARLVPLWSARRGMGYLIDPEQNKLYRADRGRSQAWRDIQEVSQRLLRARYNNLVRMIVQQWNVPVVQTWAGWNGPYSSAGSPLAGVGIRLSRTGFLGLAEEAGRAALVTHETPRPSVLLATDVSLPASADQLPDFMPVVQDSATLGVRGWFFRAETEEARSWVATLRGTLKPNLPRPRLLPFPESAEWPSAVMRIGPNVWSVPSPAPGNRLDLGGTLLGYRSAAEGDEFFALWTTGAAQRVRLRYAQPQSILVTSPDGVPVAVKRTRNHVELTLGPMPVVVRGSLETPVAEEAIAWSRAEFESLSKLLPPAARDMIDEIVVIQNAFQALPKNPSTSFDTIRVQLARLRSALSPVIWQEAEFAQRHNWSEVRALSGASNREALSLLSRVNPLRDNFEANYTINPRMEGNQVVWVSARGSGIPDLQVDFGGQTLSPEIDGVQPYGGGFRWYRFGRVNLPARALPLRLLYRGLATSDVDVDVIMIAPEGLNPTGPAAPGAPF